jgi:hypothetical protein
VDIRPDIVVSLINPLNTELNPICHLLELLGAHFILHFSRIRVNVAVARFPTGYRLSMLYSRRVQGYDKADSPKSHL